MTSKVVYLGDLRTELIHIKSGDKVITDAPTDNQGKGEAFSPTDLLATSLATCMITMVGIKARELEIDIKGTEASITKVMASSPRRVSEIHVHLKFACSVNAKTKKIFEQIALKCPVALSLNPAIKQKVEFEYST